MSKEDKQYVLLQNTLQHGYIVIGNYDYLMTLAQAQTFKNSQVSNSDMLVIIRSYAEETNMISKSRHNLYRAARSSEFTKSLTY